MLQAYTILCEYETQMDLACFLSNMALNPSWTLNSILFTLKTHTHTHTLLMNAPHSFQEHWSLMRQRFHSIPFPLIVLPAGPTTDSLLNLTCNQPFLLSIAPSCKTHTCKRQALRQPPTILFNSCISIKFYTQRGERSYLTSHRPFVQLSGL